MRFLTSITLLVIFTIYSNEAVCGSLDDGIAAYSKKDYALALTLLTPIAEEGNVRAQAILGDIYLWNSIPRGSSAESKYANALKWLTVASENGVPDSQLNLGIMYKNGDGVKQDTSKAIYWMERSAEQGFIPAQQLLGFAYRYGSWISTDYKKAFKWFSRAANQGDAKSQYDLGLLYFNGLGVTKNYILAFMWFDLASASNAEASAEYKSRTAMNLDTKQLERAIDLSRKWKAVIETNDGRTE